MSDLKDLFLELAVEEQLFAGVVHWPLEGCEGLLDHLTDVDARNGSGRTLLHVAVRMGKLDWVERLLGMGADTRARDGKGATVLDVAQEMMEKHPGEEDRRTIQRFVQLAYKIGGKTSGESVGWEGDHNGEVVHEPMVERDGVQLVKTLKRSVGPLRDEVVSLIGDLSRQLVSSYDEISSLKNQVQPLADGMAFFRETVTTIRTDMTSLIGEISPHLASSRLELNSVGERVGAVSTEVSSLGVCMADFKSEIASLSTKILSLGCMLAEAKTDVSSVKSVQRVAALDLSLLKKAVGDLDSALTARDTLLGALETSVTSLADSMHRPKESVGVKPEDETSESGPSDDEEETTQGVCIEGIMRKTWIFNETADKVAKVRGIYGKICSVSPLTSSILSFLQSQPQVMVAIDCDSNKIGGMKEHVEEHDGSRSSGSYVTSFADFAEKRVYLGSFVGPFGSENHMIGLFTRSLTQLAIFLAFRNAGKPFREGDEDLEEKFENIIDEAKERKFTEGKWINWFLYGALTGNSCTREMILISAVPAIYVESGATQGTKVLRDELPSLLDYYVDHVLVELHKTEE